VKKGKLQLPLSTIAFQPSWPEKYDIGIETLEDIIKELQVPGRDPRDDMAPPAFAGNIMDIKDLKIGDKIE
jgi:uncharacterized protein